MFLASQARKLCVRWDRGVWEQDESGNDRSFVHGALVDTEREYGKRLWDERAGGKLLYRLISSGAFLDAGVRDSFDFLQQGGAVRVGCCAFLPVLVSARLILSECRLC